MTNSKPIPKFPYPRRQYVFEIDQERLTYDNNYVVGIGVKSIFDKEGCFDDGSIYANMPTDKFYDWMDEVAEYLNIELDNMGDGDWQAVDFKDHDNRNKLTLMFIEFLRNHKNFTELKEEV